MKKITTQEELDAIREISVLERIEIVSERILKLNFNIAIKGFLKISTKVESSFSSNYFVAWENSSVVAWGNSSVEAWGNSSVEARENSSVVAKENSSVVAKENSSVEAWGNSSVEARENSSVVAKENSSVVSCGNSSVVAWGNSSVEARENSSVVAKENSSVVSCGNSSVVAWGNSSVKLTLNYSLKVKVKLFGFSVCWKPKHKNISVEIKSSNSIIQEYYNLPFLEREDVEIIDKKVILYKRVSNDFKTQEETCNETSWLVGSIVEHHEWRPHHSECGEGKFHACSKGYFCDEFRNKKTDKYVAIEVDIEDLFEWTISEPLYPHKIAFRKCKVLFECDKYGKIIK